MEKSRREVFRPLPLADLERLLEVFWHIKQNRMLARPGGLASLLCGILDPPLINSLLLPSGHQEKDFIASCNLIMWDGTRILSGRSCGNYMDIYPYVNAMYFNCFMVVIKGPPTNAKFIPVGLSMTFYLDTFRSERFKPPQFNPALGPEQSSGVLVDLNEDGALPLVEPNSRLLQQGIN